MSIIEIRAAEGGDEAKLLVREQFSIGHRSAPPALMLTGILTTLPDGSGRSKNTD
jgi:protein subunit release factor A